MKKQLLVLGLLSGFLAMQGAQAMTREEHSAAKDKIEADYKVDKARCDSLKDNAKDICEKEAKGKEDVAKAELEQSYKPSDSNARKVEEAKADAAYAVAKEKCDDQAGDAKKACQKDAKNQHDMARKSIKR
ncbi:hypothetical protein [Xylophilus sp.]|uniref:hypothetical protein n=1 Tax=Xylophilus sp. TaxID=2653893 RepID=UPI0013B63891|nr:hypothetical protein [Xylophilus sp.]KAF1049535.1 MAG: hypothetical protein GAK38_00634 [Xylophilus sp.]